MFFPELSTEGVCPQVEREDAEAWSGMSSPPAAGTTSAGDVAGPGAVPGGTAKAAVASRRSRSRCHLTFAEAEPRIPRLAVRGESRLLRGPRLLRLPSSPFRELQRAGTGTRSLCHLKAESLGEATARHGSPSVCGPLWVSGLCARLVSPS